MLSPWKGLRVALEGIASGEGDGLIESRLGIEEWRANGTGLYILGEVELQWGRVTRVHTVRSTYTYSKSILVPAVLAQRSPYLVSSAARFLHPNMKYQKSKTHPPIRHYRSSTHILVE